MRKLEWFLNNFAAGVHSYQSRQPQGDVFAHRLQNVKAGPEGHLRHWSPGRSLDDTNFDGRIGGVAADEKRWYRLSEVDVGVRLWFRYLDKRLYPNYPEFSVTGSSEMEGRLFVIGEFGDFVIVGSEGDDRGYWMDVRDTVEQGEHRLHELGMVPPVEYSASNGSVSSHALADGLYVYAFTNVRAFFGDVDNVPFPRQIAQKALAGPERLFNGMESNPTYLVVAVGGVTGNFYHKGERIERVVELPSNNGGLFISGVEYPFGQQTGVYVYRTLGEVTEHGDPVASQGFSQGFEANVEDLEFRVIDYLERGETQGVLHSAVSLEDRPLMRIDNDVLPEGAFMLTYYNDLVVCATGDELRYSDVRNGAPVQWAFPAVNAVRAPGRIQFCMEYEGTLLFGGSQGMWRLTGTDEFNFQRSQFSAIGPVSRSAFGKLAKGIGFVGSGGLYVTDGVEVVKVSPGVLDGYFEGKQAVDGAVQVIGDGDELWVVRFGDGSQTQFLRSSKGGWFVAAGLEVHQSVRVSAVDGEGNTDEEVLFADGSDVVKEIDWLDVHSDNDAEWFWESQELDWEAQGQGESVKTFKWLEIASSLEHDVTVRFEVDGDVFEEQVSLVPGFRPVRVPIRRRGIKFRFRVFGRGAVHLRGLRVICEVRDQRRRF